MKALYLGTFEIAKKWTMPIRHWGKVRGELEIIYPERLSEICSNNYTIVAKHLQSHSKYLDHTLMSYTADTTIVKNSSPFLVSV